MTRVRASDLRAMLHRRAGDIDTVPPHLLDDPPGREPLYDGDPESDPSDSGGPEPPSRSGRPSTRWVVAAVVAAVLVIAGGVVGFRQLTTRPATEASPPGLTTGSHHPAPATTAGEAAPRTRTGGASAHAAPTGNTAPSTGPASRSTATSQPSHGAPRSACTAALPAEWRQALASNGSTFGAQSARPLSITADGKVLVVRDFGHGGKRDLVLVDSSPNPTASEPLFTVSDPDRLGIENAYLYRNWFVVAVGSKPRPPKGEIPGSAPMPNVAHLYVIDRDTGARTAIASAPISASGAGSAITSAVLVRGTVYWDQEPSYGATTGTIYSYDLATGRKSTVYTGPNPQIYAGSSVSAAGIVAGGRIVVPMSLPAPVADARADDAATWTTNVQTDGTAYAWISSADVIGWWAPGHGSPRYVRLAAPLSPSRYPDLLAVAGQYVVVQSGDPQIIDMATGAVVMPKASGSHMPITLARGRTVVGFSLVGQGHWEDGYWVDPQEHVSVIDVSELPEPTC